MKHIIRKILKEEFKTSNLKNGKSLVASQWAEDFIKGHEKLRLTAYDIGDNHITIGYGHAELKSTTKLVANKTKITKEKADQYFKSDYEEAYSCINRLFKQWESIGIDIPLNQNMFDVLTSLSFNSGCNTVRQSSFIQQLKIGEYQKAGEQIKTHGLVDGFGGLSTRRNKESQHFLS
tara:strand:+ start:846 stop:1376 length:531 start_codon:yes stop_codon:yes gene_type:complete